MFLILNKLGRVIFKLPDYLLYKTTLFQPAKVLLMAFETYYFFSQCTVYSKSEVVNKRLCSSYFVGSPTLSSETNKLELESTVKSGLKGMLNETLVQLQRTLCCKTKSSVCLLKAGQIEENLVIENNLGMTKFFSIDKLCCCNAF